jgi:AAHS family 4-hydroxybenzoate transporter-like MFS transporter
LRWITPLLWIAYIASSMAVFFIANWTPLLAEALGETHDQAAISGSFHSLGGALGGLLLMRFIDNRGAIAGT